ncbi:conserved hypothetical protein [Photorhabdus asymbiotica]|uniref:Uncharacterized protein n=2 Tax=Photorhabdus asymbiotica TaxID=291112 RepID=B6VMP9_PHOAA|nr:hypothetical protein BDD30_2687 [Photorhabdus asymbiotica]CAQ82805.1 conserved hypothetical protein [Photorhabdus asymbiotica]CAR67429.1 Hypothetical Protein PA-RVA13-1300 [Photorhabdus asymbiotica subsp. asymbiotica ATCC 43949]
MIPVNLNNFSTLSEFPLGEQNPTGHREHIAIDKNSSVFSGLSPSVRGTSISLLYQTLTVRFIPVSTGNILPKPEHISISSVHPRIYPSSFKLLLCWLLSLTPVTELSRLLGIRSLATALQLEIYWVYKKRLLVLLA